MISNSLKYHMDKYGINDNRLLVCYDFQSGNVFSVQSGSSYQSYVRNLASTGVNGNLDGKIINATGISADSSLLGVTGIDGFINNGQEFYLKMQFKYLGQTK